MPNKVGKIVIAPNDESIFDNLAELNTIIHTNSIDDVQDIFNKLQKKTQLVCIKVNSSKSLSEINLNDGLRSIPIALFVPEVGDLTEILLKAQDLNSYNLQVYLPAEESKNIRDLRILSSVGISCGFYFKDSEADINWEQLDDLFYYYAYTKTKKGSIEPFRYMATNDTRDNNFNFKTALFDNSSTFIYLDKDGNYATSSEELNSGNYTGSGFDALMNHVNESEQPSNSQKANMFVGNEVCSYCSAFPICRSNYFDQCQKNEGYKMLLDSITEYVYANQSRDSSTPNKTVTKWQL